MSIVYRIDKEIGATLVVWDGVVTDEDFMAHTEKMLADPDWPPESGKHLIDQTSLISYDLISTPVLDQVTSMWLSSLAAQVAKMRIVMVADKKFESTGLFDATIPGYSPNVTVFNIIPTACVWLGLDVQMTEQALQALRNQVREAGSG